MDPKQPRLPAREPVLRALIDICGPDFARPATIADSVAGRLASFVATPATPRAVAATMRLAAERGLAVVARGSGSKLDWGKPPPGVDLILDTGRLNGIWHHNREQATAEIATGTAIRAIQAALALRGQRLAVDPPTPSATLGGVLARNEAGPLRHRFGTPAAQVHKVTYTTRDGHEAESDGENGSPGIAEIDGVLLSATVHVEPLPEARRWVRTPVQDPREAPELATLAQAAQPSAVEIDLPAPAANPELAVLIEGTPDDATLRANRLAATIGTAAHVTSTAPAWWGRYPFGEGDIALRLTMPVTELPAAVLALSDVTGLAVPLRGSTERGALHAVLPGTMTAGRVEGILDAVRGVLLARGGRCVAITAPPEISGVIDMAQARDLF